MCSPFKKSGSIKELIQQYSLEARAGQYEFSRALADFNSADENALNFRRGDIIAIVPREDAYTQRGWLYGVKVRTRGWLYGVKVRTRGWLYGVKVRI